jgi:hypothetical protein
MRQTISQMRNLLSYPTEIKGMMAKGKEVMAMQLQHLKGWNKK